MSSTSLAAPSDAGALACLHGLAVPLRREHASPAAALQAVLAELMGVDGVQRAIVAVSFPEEKRLSIEAAAGAPEPEDALVAPETPLGRAASLWQPIAQVGTLTDAAERASSAVRATCVPIVARGAGPVGVLAWERVRRAEEAPHGDIELLGVAAALIAHTVSRLRADREAWHERRRERVRDGGMLAQIRAHGFLARTELSRQALSQVRQAATSAAGMPVLISGESGVGKSLLAHTLHVLGPHAQGELRTIACDALGAADAQQGPQGWLERSHGGTLLLEHVDRLGWRAQAQLLRALQVPQVLQRVTLVATTRADLAAEAKALRFRGDLYYRLQSFSIEVAPLRERSGDVVPLAEHFLLTLADARRGLAPQLAPAAARKLVAYDWPGNVRELHNVVERALLTTRGPFVEAEAVLLRPAGAPAGDSLDTETGTLDERMRRFERKLLFDALQRARGRKAAAARALGMTARAFAYRLSR